MGERSLQLSLSRGLGMRLFSLPTALALTTFACTPAAPPTEIATDTLPSGRVVLGVPDLLTQRQAYTPHEVTRLGALDGDGPDLFGDIRDLALGPNGEIVVLDGQASEVRVFSSAGEFDRYIGSDGEGPGELLRPAGIDFGPAGLLWVNNAGNARYSAFDLASGELIEESRRPLGFTAYPWPGAMTSAGLIDVGLDPNGDIAIIRLDASFVPIDTLPAPRPDDAHMVAFRRNGQMAMSAMDPFAPQPSWAPLESGDIVVGEGGEYRLHWIDFAGDTSRTLELARPRIEVTRFERDSALAAFEEISTFAGGATPDRAPIPADYKPAHGTIDVDDQDRVWVRATETRSTEWDVYTQGEPIGRVGLPEGVRALRTAVRGTHMLVSVIEEGVPQVVLYELRP